MPESSEENGPEEAQPDQSGGRSLLCLLCLLVAKTAGSESRGWKAHDVFLHLEPQTRWPRRGTRSTKLINPEVVPSCAFCASSWLNSGFEPKLGSHSPSSSWDHQSALLRFRKACAGPWTLSNRFPSPAMVSSRSIGNTGFSTKLNTSEKSSPTSGSRSDA